MFYFIVQYFLMVYHIINFSGWFLVLFCLFSYFVSIFVLVLCVLSLHYLHFVAATSNSLQYIVLSSVMTC